jgi:hypothetical protein
MTGKIIVKSSGEEIKVHATKEHPDSHYNHAVWVDESNNAYFEVGKENTEAVTALFELVLDEPWETRRRLGKEFARLRTEKGISVRKMGEIAECSFVAISRFELGKTSASLDNVARLFSFFGKRLNVEDDK